MGMIRLEPFRDLLTSQKEFKRLFNETFPFRFGNGEEQSTRPWAPPVDIYETENELVFKADLPGVDPKNVDIHVENGVLYVKGERHFEKEVKEENYHRIERSYGAFARSFSLPDSIDEVKVKAEYKDGQLTLTLPKREEAKPKTIKINVAKA
ncbi:MAG TPA: Hsp20/alpha crystallin family protein [Terriglobia bacterium]|nr:Hsp20/alpha crystallin family protein [Terriglobia bacterium]